MSFGRELADFVQGFSSTYGMMEGIKDKRAQRDYTAEATRKMKLANDETVKLGTISAPSGVDMPGYNGPSSGSAIPEVPQGSYPEAGAPTQVPGDTRDVLIRTVAGEAGGEGADGQAAVAHVIMNRSRDSRGMWPSDPREVALQPKQFSTWNQGEGGNHIPRSIQPGSEQYEAIGKIVDGVLGGKIADPTHGAVYYYAPQGMEGGAAPRWWANAKAERGGNYLELGNHRFAGMVKPRAAAPAAAPSTAAVTAPRDLSAYHGLDPGEVIDTSRFQGPRDATTPGDALPYGDDEAIAMGIPVYGRAYP